MKKVEVATQKRIEVVTPQLIPQDQLDMAYVNKWKALAEKSLRIKRNVSTHNLRYRDYPLYHWKKSSVSGVWFIAIDGKTVDYLYAYESLRLEGIHKASEALAYLFNEDVSGVTERVFFEHLLPDLKFVVTDSIYTPLGHRWFRAEYNDAFGRGYNVYAIDLGLGKGQKIRRINKSEFDELQSLYWGKDTQHQKYRFAIELP